MSFHLTPNAELESRFPQQEQQSHHDCPKLGYEDVPYDGLTMDDEQLEWERGSLPDYPSTT